MIEPLNQKIEEARKLISFSEKIILATHEHPDGDGFAAMLAFYFWLKSVGKEPVLFIKERLPQYLKFLPGIEYISREIPEGKYELLIGFDYGDFERLGMGGWLGLQEQIKVIAFDHHAEGRQGGDIHVIDTRAASTTIVVHKFLNLLRAEITPRIATCVLAGIVADTGGFIHSNADIEAFDVAADMMRRGADFMKVVRGILNKKNPLFLRLWGEALLRIKLDSESGLALSWIGAEDFKKHGADREAVVDFSGVLSTVTNSRSAVFLSQEANEPNMVKGSLRSEEYKGVDVSRLASLFGGGGHKLAAGFKIEGRLQDVIQKLILEAKTLNRFKF
ncbi:MAG: DHH family phosphoesterase [bacterium]|nr:DHH family phosphoesterase [bacterium]